MKRVVVIKRLSVVAAAAAGAMLATALAAAEPQLTHAQSAYLASCGGCHGIQGVSAQEQVPDLRDRAGYFLCTDEGRQYIVRLPNVAFAARSDAELADLLNFVMFDLGGPSAPAKAPRYTAEEIGELRKGPHIITGLRARRHAVLLALVRACKAPDTIARQGQGY